MLCLKCLGDRKHILIGGNKMNGNKIASVLCSVATILNIITGNLEIAIITGILSLLNTLVA